MATIRQVSTSTVTFKSVMKTALFDQGVAAAGERAGKWAVRGGLLFRAFGLEGFSGFRFFCVGLRF